MKSYCLLLVVLCSVYAIGVDATKLRSKTKSFTPSEYYIEISEFDGIKATDVGVGADGSIWYLSNEKDGDNYFIYRLQDGVPVKVGGSAKWISVSKEGIAWVITNANKIYYYNGGSSWKEFGGKGYDISCSPDGNVFHIGTSNGLYVMNRDKNDWQKMGGSGIRIAGGPSQSVWHSNTNNNIYRRYPGGDWEQMPGKATDLAISANGLVWILTTESVPNQFAVFDEYKQDWINVPLDEYLSNSGESWNYSKTVRIAAAPNGDLIGVREDFSMFKLRFNWRYTK